MLRGLPKRTSGHELNNLQDRPAIRSHPQGGRHQRRKSFKSNNLGNAASPTAGLAETLSK
ncbi:hypothetical protein Pla111_16970 [Botrimarina hoheduenensis]|uniref:Uncharacterized protein n=1 Tax=Botrimarina hoheduenensis TaxID=2528000 RepID=A0A5C5W9B7_9BACT|nr:hypothetical protein Pla111_16970 [Botrimarina hoheduenensis]